jgi:chromosome segregation ATPase
MTRLLVITLLGLLGTSCGVSPVQKVVELLAENKAKVAKDLEAEGAEMKEYSDYCDTEASERGYSIKTAERKILDLTASIEDAEAQIVSYKDEIATLGSEAAAKEAQLAGASTERKAEKAEFEASEKELMTSLDQLTRAVTIIKREMSFVQVKGAKGKAAKRHPKDIKAALGAIAKVIDASWVEASQKKSLKALLQTQAGSGEGDGEDDDLTLKLKQPQAKVVAYESSSGGIVEQIEEMKQKAEETLSATRSTEMKEAHNYDMMAQSLTDATKNLNEQISMAKSSMATMLEENGKAKAELTETKKSKAADEAFSATLKQDCENAARMWEERQASAKDEMGALDKAKEILTAGVRVFVQTNIHNKKGDADGDDDDDEDKTSVARHKIMDKLKDLSKSFKSYALMELVSAARSDPFEKVRGLIESMIDKLITEANEEATQKAFCDEEMSKSKDTKEEKTATMDKLQSRLDKAATTKAQLEQAVKELEGEIASLDAGTAEATKIRNEAHASYLKASSDFKDAAEAVTNAIRVLKEYYEGALIQTKTSVKAKQPDFGGAKSDAAHSILSILEMSAEDFTKLYMEEEGKETEAVDEYKKLMQENKVSKAAKQAEVKGDLSEIKSLTVALENNKEDYDMTSKELDAVLAYMEKLKPQCETKVMSYAEKKARREAEIEGLKEALGILDGSAPAFLQLRGARKH